jgi:hypothetical protein
MKQVWISIVLQVRTYFENRFYILLYRVMDESIKTGITVEVLKKFKDKNL